VSTQTSSELSGWKQLVVFVAVCVGLLAALPLLGLLGLSLQFVLPLGAAAAAVHLYRRSRLAAEAGRTFAVRGVAVPRGTFVHDRHAWARKGSARSVAVGVDDFLRRSLGEVEGVRAPKLGTLVRRGQAMAVVRSGNRRLVVHAPLDGEVTRVNSEVLARPELMREDPYGAGWLVEVTPRNVQDQLTALRPAEQAMHWMAHEIDRLTALLTQGGPERATAALADGGELVADYGSRLDARTWRRVAQTFF
jgi:glycine cleavage system H protein